jgi:hypothetical protein
VAAEPVAHDREGAVQIPNLAVLCHVRVLCLVEDAHVQRRRISQGSAHVFQALEGNVLVGVPGQDQAWLMNQTLKRLHRECTQRPQYLARFAQAREVSGLL